MITSKCQAEYPTTCRYHGVAAKFRPPTAKAAETKLRNAQNRVQTASGRTAYLKASEEAQIAHAESDGVPSNRKKLEERLAAYEADGTIQGAKMAINYRERINRGKLSRFDAIAKTASTLYSEKVKLGIATKEDFQALFAGTSAKVESNANKSVVRDENGSIKIALLHAKDGTPSSGWVRGDNHEALVLTPRSIEAEASFNAAVLSTRKKADQPKIDRLEANALKSMIGNAKKLGVKATREGSRLTFSDSAGSKIGYFEVSGDKWVRGAIAINGQDGTVDTLVDRRRFEGRLLDASQNPGNPVFAMPEWTK